jgi:hypothetical protein
MMGARDREDRDNPQTAISISNVNPVQAFLGTRIRFVLDISERLYL